MIEINGVYYTANHLGLFMLMGLMLLTMIGGIIWAGVEDLKAKKREKAMKDDEE